MMQCGANLVILVQIYDELSRGKAFLEFWVKMTMGYERIGIKKKKQS